MLGSLSEPDRIRPHGRDDNAAGAACPARRLAPRRVSKPLRSCTPNTWDKSGRPRAEAAKSAACNNAGWRLLLCASRDEPIHFASKLLGCRREGCAPGVDHDVPFRRKFRKTKPKHFPQPSLHPVAINCLSERARNGETQPGTQSAAPGRFETWRASCGVRRQKAVKYWPAILVPCLYAFRKSEVLRIRAVTAMRVTA